MRNIHNPNEYHKYKSTTGGNGNSSGGGSGGGPSVGGWIVITIVIIMLISFIADGASWDAIDTLLGLGLLAYLFFNSVFK
ncbi:MAG: hypothetical protein IJE45_03015 [Bacilli bacterium]|nr:hypothetical protein [Bacilli bacterium]